MKLYRLVLAAVLIFAAATTATADERHSWTIRVHGAFVDSSAGSQTVNGDDIVSKVDIGGGIGLGAEYRISEQFGLDCSVLLADLDIASGIREGDVVQDLGLSMVPLSFGVPFHFSIGDRVDIYVGPTFSIVRYLDLETRVGNGGVGLSLEEESDAAMGAMLGLDLPLGSGKWALSLGLRYMETSASDADIDPVLTMIGFAVRF